MTMKQHLLAGVALFSLASVPALAADLAMEAPPVQMAPTPIEVGGGWYLRGDVGVGSTEFGSVGDTAGILARAPSTYSFPYNSHSAQTIVGAGLGYQFNEYFRADLTAEYRGASNFSYGLQAVVNCGSACTQYNNHFDGRRSSIVGLVNAYADLGNFSGITPFVGVGLGYASHSISAFNDQGFTGSTGGYGYAKDSTSSSFAWALHAGLGYQVNQALKLELSYRYLNMGNVGLGRIVCQSASGPNCQSMTYEAKDVTSHDFRLGMRWMLGAPAASAPVVSRF